MTLRKELVTSLLCAAVSGGSVLLLSTGITARVGASGPAAKDPGVRAAAADAGTPLSTLSADQLAFFQDGLTRFNATDSVGGAIAGEPDAGPGANVQLQQLRELPCSARDRRNKPEHKSADCRGHR